MRKIKVDQVDKKPMSHNFPKVLGLGKANPTTHFISIP